MQCSTRFGDTAMMYDLLEIYEVDVQNKTMGYSLVRRINERDIAAIDNCIACADYLMPFVHLWSAIEINLGDINQTLKSFAENHQGTLKSSRDKKIYISSHSNIMARANNFLSSANLFLTYMEQNTTSDNCKREWNIKRRALHAENPNYRLCYELRNHAQHAGLPISAIEVKNIDSQKDVQGVIYLEKDSITNSGRASEKLKKHISEFDSDVDLISAFESYQKSIAELFEYFIMQHKQYFDIILSFYDQYSKIQLENSEGSLVYVHKKVPDNEITIKMTRLRLSKFKYIIDVIKQVKSIVSNGCNDTMC